MKDLSQIMSQLDQQSRREPARLLRGQVKVVKKSDLEKLLEEYVQLAGQVQDQERSGENEKKLQEELDEMGKELEKVRGERDEFEELGKKWEGELETKEAHYRDKIKGLEEEIRRMKAILESDEHLARIESLEIRLASLDQDYKRLSQSCDYLDMIELPPYEEWFEQIASLQERLQEVFAKKSLSLEQAVQPGSMGEGLQNIKEHLVELKKRLDRNQKVTTALLDKVESQSGEISHVVELVRICESDRSIWREVKLVGWTVQIVE